MRSMRNWYLIKTKPRQENVAIKNLENQKYVTYCPTVTINNKHVVLFPGYIFIHLDNKNENWSPIRSTKGVVNFVRFGLNFAKVPDTVIEFIKANQQITVDKLKDLNKFKSGDKVQISDGAFKNWIGIFKCYSPDERIILLLKLLGNEQSLSFEKELVIAI